MGDWHLNDLRRTLENKGWQIVAEHKPEEEDWNRSGTWEIQRSTRRRPLLLDFEGGDDGLKPLPMPQSYACHVRDHSEVGVYFWKQRSRAKWNQELREFMASLTTSIEKWLTINEVT